MESQEYNSQEYAKLQRETANIELYTDYLEKIKKVDIPGLLKVMENSNNVEFLKSMNHNLTDAEYKIYTVETNILKQVDDLYRNKIVYFSIYMLESMVTNEITMKFVLDYIIGIKEITNKSVIYLYSVFDIVNASSIAYKQLYKYESSYQAYTIDNIRKSNFIETAVEHKRDRDQYIFFVTSLLSNTLMNIYCYASDIQEIGLFINYNKDYDGDDHVNLIYKNFLYIYEYFSYVWNCPIYIDNDKNKGPNVLKKFLDNLESICDKDFVKSVEKESEESIVKKQQIIINIVQSDKKFAEISNNIYAIVNTNIEIKFSKKREIQEKSKKSTKSNKGEGNKGKGNKKEIIENKPNIEDMEFSNESEEEEKNIDLNEKKEKLSKLNPSVLKDLLLVNKENNKLFYYYDAARLNITCMKVVINTSKVMDLPYVFMNKGGSNLKLKIGGSLQYIRQEQNNNKEKISKYILYVGLVKCNKSSQILSVLEKSMNNMRTSKTVEIKKDMYIIWSYSLDLKFSINKLSQVISSSNNINISMNEKVFPFYYFIKKETEELDTDFGSEYFKSFGYLKFMFNYTII